MGRGLTIVLSVGILFFIVVMVSPRIIATTNNPEFCARCHVMEEQYLTLMKGGLHNSIKCVDCHLPNSNKISFYIWKGIDGTSDVVHFYSGNVPEKIQASEHAKKTIQANCIRCHEGMVSAITIADRKCWDCHKRTSHRQAGLRETI